MVRKFVFRRCAHQRPPAFETNTAGAANALKRAQPPENVFREYAFAAASNERVCALLTTLETSPPLFPSGLRRPLYQVCPHEAVRNADSRRHLKPLMNAWGALPRLPRGGEAWDRHGYEEQAN